MKTLQLYLQNPKTRAALAKRPGDEGFSLIELVVVVAVLAILAAIAIPAFTGLQDDAAHSGAKTNLAQIAKECAYTSARASSATATHTALISANSTTYNTVATGTDCTTGGSSIAQAVVSRGTSATYTVNLLTGAKSSNW